MATSSPAADIDPDAGERPPRHPGPAGFKRWDRAELRGTVTRRFEAQAREHPDRPAVEGPRSLLTYAELNRQANRLADELRERLPAPGERIGILLDHEPAAIVALLGILKAGHIAAPLPPAAPPAVLSAELLEIGARALVTDEARRNTIARTLSFPGWIVPVDPDGSEARATDPAPFGTAGEPAFLLHTSGTTGSPKAVIQTHQLVLRNVRTSTHAYRLSPEDRLPLFNAPVTGHGLAVVFRALLNGACLCLHDLAHGGLESLPAWMRARHISIWQGSASIFRRFAALADLREPLPDLRLISLGSERIHPRDVELWRCRFSADCALAIAYATTETGNITQFAIDRDAPPFASTVPVGFPVEDMEVLIVNDEGRQLPNGARGQIVVRSCFLSPGYWNQPELTRRAFTSPDAEGFRAYRTGDLGCLDTNGCLHHLGRVDHQLKVRGYRVESEEVERHLRDHAGVLDGAVALSTDSDGESELVAYVITSSSAPPTVEALREWLASRLLPHEVPTRYRQVDQLPRNPGGKLSRSELASLPATPLPAGSSRIAPATGLERVLAGIWLEVLRIEEVGTMDNFFTLGGHSLKVTQVVVRIAAGLGIRLPSDAVFAFPTISALAREIERRRTASPVPPEAPLRRCSRPWDTDPAGDAPAIFPASAPQQRLWFLHGYAPESPVYNVSLAYSLRGALAAESLELAVRGVIERHESLRTRFELRDGQLVQLIDPPAAANSWLLERVGAPPDTPEQPDDALAREIRVRTDQPFDLARGPLLRGTLFKHSPDHHLLLLVRHHSVTDGWSAGVFRRELAAHYAAASEIPSPLPALPVLPVHYADYTVWQQERGTGAFWQPLTDYWVDRLRDLPPTLDLPADRPRPESESYRGARHRFHLPPALVAGLERLAEAHEATLFMVLLATFKALLFRHSRQTDIVVGAPVANRTHPELEPLIGFFVNLLVLRTDLAGDPPFSTALGRVRDTVRGAYAHQDLPFERLVQQLNPERQTDRAPLFQVLFAFQGFGDEELELPGIEVERRRVDPGTSHFDLSVLVRPLPATRDLEIDLDYATDLFDADRIGRLAGHWQEIVRAVVRDAGIPLSRLPLLPDEERRRLLQASTGAHRNLGFGTTIHGWFARQASLTPDALAVLGVDGQLTFAALDEASTALAVRLRDVGAGPNVPVALFLEPSVDLTVALLAILKSGGAYLPLDPGLPVRRLNEMLADSGCSIVLSRRSLAGRCPAPGARWVLLDETGTNSKPRPLEADTVSQPSDLAYILYTSGSTGRPKGVAMPHRPLVSLVRWQIESSRGGPRTLQFASPGFDVSFQEIFSTWLAGGTVVIPPAEVRLDPTALWEFIDHHRIERLFLPVVVLHLLAEAAANSTVSAPALAEIITAGERLRVTPAVRRLCRSGPGRSLHNHYGPTESHVVVAWSLPGLPENWPEFPPIGTPLPNTRVYVLDEQGQPSPLGIAGEVYIGGPALARGYWNRPDLTAERFLPDPFDPSPDARLYRTGDLARFRPDGVLEYLGRTDHQVKIRGFRVELGEIECALRDCPGIRDACVIVNDADGDRRLIAYLVGDAAALDTVREQLHDRLPGHMIPAILIPLPALPLNANGKVHRQALPPPHLAPAAPGALGPTPAGAFVPPRSPLEAGLHAAWARLLGHGNFGIHESFFQIGGHSLLAIRLVRDLAANPAIARARPLPHLNVALIFRARTISELALAIATPDEGPPRPTVYPLQPAGREPPLLFVNAGLDLWELAHRLGPDQPSFGLRLTYDTDALAAAQRGLAIPRPSLAELVHGHLELLRRQWPRGPYRLAGFCNGGVIMLEMARQLLAAGESVPTVILLDTRVPGFARLRNVRLERWLERARRTLRESPAEWARHLANWRKERRRLRNLAEPDEAVSHHARLIHTNQSILAAAALEFAGPPLPVPGLLIRALESDAPPLRRRHADLNLALWRLQFSAGLDAEDVDAAHDAMFRKPAVDAVARIIQARLVAAQSQKP